MKLIDLRSDTLTQPTEAMRLAMLHAPVGDDVFQEDPTVRALETLLATRSGKEAALFAPSGTQSNLLGIMAHCERGDEYIVGQTAHTYAWEGGGAAVLGSIQPQPLDFEEDGSLDLDKVALAIKPLNDHHPRSKLLCLENTTAGKVLPLSYLETIKPFCAQNGLFSHLDGARVFNAAVKLGVELPVISQHFDSISICLSKGLGAPVGSVLCGSQELITKARRWRKVLGGGMRQAGILAAAGIYAVENHIARLKEDHDHAQELALGLSQIQEMTIDPSTVQTNIIYLPTPPRYSALHAFLKEEGINFPKQANKKNLIRLVTHLDVSTTDIARVIGTIKKFYTQS